MIHYKTKEEIDIMRRGGKILAAVLFEVLKHAKPGVSELELNNLAEKLIKQAGGEPGFQRVPGWKHAICASTNDVIVHGIPTNYRLQNGDVFGLDCGVYLEGFNTDMSETIRINQESGGNKKDEIDLFIETGKSALNKAIEQVKSGNRVGHISHAIQSIIEHAGYSVVRSLVGHGVGRQLHEEPEIPGYLAKPIEKTPLLQEGMVIAIEVIYNMGAKDVVYADDGWTIKTKDGSLSGLFERTVVVTKHGHEILTK